MSKAKDKGRRLENLVVKTLTDNDISAKRIPLSGSLGGEYTDDVVIGTIENPIARIECKNREQISKNLWEWLEGVDYLVVKKNQHKPLVIMDMDKFIEIIKCTL